MLLATGRSGGMPRKSRVISILVVDERDSWEQVDDLYNAESERVELLWDRPDALRQSILLDWHAPSIKSRKIAVAGEGRDTDVSK
jgi:hypothetical protein